MIHYPALRGRARARAPGCACVLDAMASVKRYPRTAFEYPGYLCGDRLSSSTNGYSEQYPTAPSYGVSSDRGHVCAAVLCALCSAELRLVLQTTVIEQDGGKGPLWRVLY